MAKDSTIYAPLHHGLWISPKLKEVCRATGLPGPYIAGHLGAIWTHTANSRPEGILTGWTDARIEAVAEWQGEPGALVAAIVAAGFAHRAGECDCPCMDGLGTIQPGTVVLHEWALYTGAGLSRRTADARRKRERRTASTGRPQDGPHMSVDVRGTSAGHPQVSADSPHMSALTGPDRTRPDRTGPDRRGGDPTGPAPAAPEPPPPPAPGGYLTVEERAQESARRAVAAMHRSAVGAKQAAKDAITGRPQTVDELLAWDPDGKGPCGKRWADRFPALDGLQGRPTLREALENLWDASQARSWGMGAQAASYAAWWATRLSEDHAKARRTYDRDRGSPADEATRSRAPSDPLYPRYQQAREAGQTALGWQEWREAQSKPAAKAPKAAAPGPGKALEHGQDLPDDQLVEVGQLFGSLAAKLGGGR